MTDALENVERELKALRPDYRVERASQGIGFHKKLVYLTALWTKPGHGSCSLSKTASKDTVRERRAQLAAEVLEMVKAGHG